MSETPTLNAFRHRVVNDFSLVQTLLSMAMRTTDDAAAARLLRGSLARVRVIALSHVFAGRGGADALSAAETRTYLSDIVRGVERAHGRGQVVLGLSTRGVALGFTEVVAVGMILNELVSNALEHAFPDDRKGSVTVQLLPAAGSNLVTLRVHDDGIGMAPDAEQRALGSLGLRIVKLLSEQLSGELVLRSDRNQGSDFCLCFAGNEEARAWQAS